MADQSKKALIVPFALLIWNLIGIAAYVSQATMDLNVLARTDPYQARLFAEMPHWAWLAYAVAVLTGTGGAIGLLLRRRWAIPLFVLSIAGIVAQFSRVFLMTDILAVKGWSTTLFPAFILAVAIFQLWYARRQASAALLR